MPVRTEVSRFLLSGEAVRVAIYERAKRHESERTKCLEELASTLKLATPPGEDTAASCARLMMVLQQGVNLTGAALVARSWLDRAAFLDQEIRELLVIAKNITGNHTYWVSLDEAKRYGLV
jgi:hypothetical protein